MLSLNFFNRKIESLVFFLAGHSFCKWIYALRHRGHVKGQRLFRNRSTQTLDSPVLSCERTPVLKYDSTLRSFVVRLVVLIFLSEGILSVFAPRRFRRLGRGRVTSRFVYPQ